MKLLDKEVYRPFLDSDNNIKGHEILPKIKYPELSNNETPPDEEYQDKYGNYKYKFIDGKVILNNPVPTLTQIEEDKIKSAVFEWSKRLIKGIYKGTITSFVDIKTITDNLINSLLG